MFSSFFKLVSPDIEFLVDSFFLSAFSMLHPTPFYLVVFLLIYLLINHMEVSLYVASLFSLAVPGVPCL